MAFNTPKYVKIFVLSWYRDLNSSYLRKSRLELRRLSKVETPFFEPSAKENRFVVNFDIPVVPDNRFPCTWLDTISRVLKFKAVFKSSLIKSW